MKIVLALIASLFISVALPTSVFAAATFNSTTSGVDCSGTPNSPVCQDLQSSSNPLFGPTGILTKIAGLFGLITGIISVFMVIISGLRYVTSAGDPTKTATARKGIMYAAIGILVASAAGAIAQFILSKV